MEICKIAEDSHPQFPKLLIVSGMDVGAGKLSLNTGMAVMQIQSPWNIAYPY